MQGIRETLKIGSIELSVQASSMHYCSPRMDGLPLDAYDAVEIAIIADKPEDESGRGLILPSRLGVGGWDHFFEDCSSPVAGYFPADVLPALIDQLQASQRQDLRK